ncbi:mortality factor 4-like protein 1 [Sycon ciliatum]|uniref:mortality factor 4-like protein 1 n=1 Tax=Sycon ciliatum TaxID=27933 RepID=UPI0020A99484|eukprot:scpid74920/ scgid16500/ Mortality factor 4-like protein 1; MORF-related gene 15 protein; Transcription factor-like protein MRG15
MPPKKFSDGEKVLCFHGPMIYEAKCIRGQVKDKAMQYMIHYNGWNKSWDEWVPENRVLKYNDANLQKQKELQQQSKSSKKRRGGPDRTGLGDKHEKLKKAEVVEPTRKRRRGDAMMTADEDSSSKRASNQIVLTVPDALKRWLLDDNDLVNKQKQLLELPSKCTVSTFLADFKKTIESDRKRHGIASEVCAGIVEYFNVLLGPQLLYKFERAQYAQLVLDHSELSVSEIYGVEHLLRLFVRLGSVLSYTGLEEQSCNLLLPHIHAILGYLSENSQKYLSSDNYHAPPPEYHRRLS